MAIGILMILGGGFALYATLVTGLVSILQLGLLLLAIATLEIVSAFRGRHRGPFAAHVVGAILSLVAGGLLLYRPQASLVSLTLLVVAYLFASGLVRGLTAVMDRYPRWGWDVAYALVAIGLGTYVGSTWPASSLLVVGTAVGVEIVARGANLVAAGRALRDRDHHGLPGGLATA